MLCKQIMKPVSSAPALIPGRDPASNKTGHDAVHSVRLSLQQAEIMILDLRSATSKPTEPLVTSVDPTDAPYMPIDDSAGENAPRPVVLGLTSDLHLGSDRG